MDFLSSLFVWWKKQTLSTKIYTFFSGKIMGEDTLGNRYYTSFNKTKRWVIYGKENYASELSIEWHGWLHWTTDTIPIKSNKKNPGQGKVYINNSNISRNRGEGEFNTNYDYKPWVPK